MKSSDNAAHGTHQCPDCHYSSDREYRLRDHINHVHKGLKPHKCPHCQYSAAQPQTLRDHIMVIHDGIRPYKCTECVKSYGRPGQLKSHVDSVHRKIRAYKCDLCDYAGFASLFGLKVLYNVFRNCIYIMNNCNCMDCNYI